MSQHNTCSTCPATWTGLSPCHCSGCHRTFGGVRLFDNHRRASACLDPAGMLSAGRSLRRVDGVWREPEMDAAARASFA